MSYYPCCTELGIEVFHKGADDYVSRTDLLRELQAASRGDEELGERFHECFGPMDGHLYAIDVEECLAKTMR